MSENQVLACRNKINEALGEKSSTYWSLVKNWLKQIYSEEELNMKAQKMFEDCTLHLSFMVALKNRILKKSTFEPANLADYVPMYQTQPGPYLYGNSAVQVQSYSSKELFLPDKAMVLGRLLIALDDELEDATESAAEMIVEATHMFLKNLLTSIFTKYRSYNTYAGAKYNVGCPVPNPWYSTRLTEELDESTFANADERHFIDPNPDETERRKLYASSTSDKSKCKKAPITVDQVYDVLRSHKGTIPNYSIFAMARERISMDLEDSDE
uniref:Putative transcriptional adapter 1-like isoform x1 n=1 Tax=Xenopsylla cheopis TaxID=163159 RepID=A0A6M2DHM5_XENCH